MNTAITSRSSLENLGRHKKHQCAVQHLIGVRLAKNGDWALRHKHNLDHKYHLGPPNIFNFLGFCLFHLTSSMVHSSRVVL